VTLEQGVLGFLAFFWILSVSLWIAVTRMDGSEDRLLYIALFSSLLILIIHGLTDDIVYAAGETPLLFILPGIAAAIGSSAKRPIPVPISGRSVIRASAAFASISIICIFMLNPLRAAWNANLGAILMAKVELSGYPTQSWDEGSHSSDLTSSILYFQNALADDPANPTANYRLGLIDLGNRNFAGAISFLQKADRSEPGHRGIRKTLGLSYAWNGQIESATQMLKGVPEMQAESQTYAWWWQTQEREDLSTYAVALNSALARSSSSSPDDTQ
jgi:hypothetical protein